MDLISPKEQNTNVCSAPELLCLKKLNDCRYLVVGMFQGSPETSTVSDDVTVAFLDDELFHGSRQEQYRGPMLIVDNRFELPLGAKVSNTKCRVSTVYTELGRGKCIFLLWTTLM